MKNPRVPNNKYYLGGNLMAAIRLGDKLSKSTRARKTLRFDFANDLADHIFNLPTRGDLREFYLQTSPINPKSVQPDEEDPNLFALLGDYETELVKKILVHNHKIICIRGPLGSGKSTTIRYIQNTLLDRDHQNCRAANCCLRHRRIQRIDLEQIIFQSENQVEAGLEIADRLCLLIRQELNDLVVLTRKEEFVDYWAKELKRRGDGGDTTSAAFQILIPLIKSDTIDSLQKLIPLMRSDTEDGPDLEEWIRKHEELYLSNIEPSPMLRLDYLVRLWGYVVEKFYGGRDSCAFIILDNVDVKESFIQYALIDILEACARDPGPLFVLLMRVETYDQRGLYTQPKSHLIDHKGLKPSVFVLHKLERFSANPKLGMPGLLLDAAEADAVRSYLHQICEIIRNDRRPSYAEFIDSVCGNSLRNAVQIAKNLLCISKEEFEYSKITPSLLIRLSITGKEEQFQLKPDSAIANLFEVDVEEPGRLLVKARILKFLMTRRKTRRRTIHEIRYCLSAFGYSENELIRNALNELLFTRYQLLRSDGYNSYTHEQFDSAGEQKITVTDMGEGYANTLVFSLEYVQEMMLDTWVPAERVSSLPDRPFLYEKLILLAKFLQELQIADCLETEHFKSQRSLSEYTKLFGHVLISTRIIREMQKHVERVLDSVKPRSDSQEDIVRVNHLRNEVLREFRMLSDKASIETKRILEPH